MSQSQSLIRFLEDQSLTLLDDAVADVRATGGSSLQYVTDDDLRVALYTVMLKIIDALRGTSSLQAEGSEDIKTLYLRNIRDLMEFIDGQSSYTTGHTAAVVKHSVQIASLVGLSDNEINDLETAAWVHNIGLINQTQKLATLPRQLTQDEMKQARNHTVVGAEIIRPIEFLAHLVPTVRYHHHRYDGNLIPGDLQGDSLPLGSRIIALADAYQAMLEPRAYRPAMTREQALNEIAKGSGSQFDPKIVQFAQQLA